jgi:integrase
MIEELQRHNYSQSTIDSYISSVKEYAKYFHKSPDLLGAEEVRRYQLYLINDKKLSAQTVKVRMSALRFFYWKTIKRRDIYFDDLPLPKTPKKLPTVLSPEEIVQLIGAALSLMHRTILIFLYATGIRRAELCRLKLGDIDSKRMVIRIEQGKGRRDRDIPMTPLVLEALRKYWLHARSKVYLFPSPQIANEPEKPDFIKNSLECCP